LAARLIYAEIGHQLRRNGLNSVDHRAVVGTPTKLMLLGQSHLSAAWIKAAEHPPKPLDAIAYLVDGCMAQKACEPALAIPSTAANSRSAVDKIEWMLVLFERLAHERRDAMEAPRILH
jgi:phytoene synthase